MLLGPGEVVHQGNQLVGAEDDLLGVVVEEFEETALLGQQASKHGVECYTVMNVT